MKLSNEKLEYVIKDEVSVKRAIAMLKKHNRVVDAELNRNERYRSFGYSSILSVMRIKSIIACGEVCGFEVVLRAKPDVCTIQEEQGLVKIDWNVYPRHRLEFRANNVLDTLTVEVFDDMEITPYRLQRIIIRSISNFQAIHPSFRSNVLSLCKHFVWGRYPERITFPSAI